MLKKKLKKQVQKYAGALLLSWGGPVFLFIIALVIILLCLLLLWIPFLLFSLPGSFEEDSSLLWSEAPQYVDVDGMEYLWPTPTLTYISSHFGPRSRGMHRGMDMIDARGPKYTELQPIYATAEGLVTIAGSVSGYGQAIYIAHENNIESRYGHLQVGALEVKVGERVEKGQLIGRVGRGIVGDSSGPHLHFEMRVNGVAENPLKFIRPPSSSDFLVTMPEVLTYQSMSLLEVKAYLDKKNSALADDKILQAIDQAAKKHNVNPYLLIAITGQEQSFVPKSHPNAHKIIQNPWNVFGCWCSGKGSTLTTEEAAEVAAKTIVKLSQNRPESIDPIRWLNHPQNPNGIYAEHAGWWRGVSKFYQSILNEVS